LKLSSLGPVFRNGYHPWMSPLSGQLTGIAARCVLLHPPRESPESELLDALKRPDLAILSTDNVYVALAELCAAARQDADAMRAGQKSSGLILLLAHPLRLTDPASLVHAAERYAPHASVWMFDPAGTPRLRSAKAEDVESWAVAQLPRHPAPAKPGTPAVPPGRAAVRRESRPGSELSVHDQHPIAPAPRDFGKSRQDGGLLSSEELAMLLALDAGGGHNEHDRSS
jgi:hypothetical protein